MGNLALAGGRADPQLQHHQVIKGRRFPTCRHCKGIRFELAHAAKASLYASSSGKSFIASLVEPDRRQVLVDVMAGADLPAFDIAAIRHDAIAP